MCDQKTNCTTLFTQTESENIFVDVTVVILTKSIFFCSSSISWSALVYVWTYYSGKNSIEPL